jgi:hypothetical protein
VTSYHLALAHLVLENDQYRYFYAARKRQGDFLIMDNSVIELEDPLPIADLLKAVIMTRADELVLPDHPWNSRATLEDAYVYAGWMWKNNPDINLMGVPQGENVEDWMQCFADMVQIPNIDTIGIPKSLGSNRLKVLKMIDDAQPTLPLKDYHLLGTWGNPTEVQYASNHYSWIRGCDSKIPVRAGLAGVQFHPTQGLIAKRAEIPSLDFDALADPFPIITQYNVNRFIKWAQGEVHL